MNEYNIDFHIHSKYSGGTSPEMELPVIASQAQLKGLDVMGTSDCLHGKWLKHMRDKLQPSAEGVYSIKDSKTKFIVTTEIEDERRVHHILLFPSIESAEDMRDRLKKLSPNLDSDGRPNLRLNGEALVDCANEVDALVGPSHAFTPWTAVYKEYGSLRECYGSNLKHIKFLELGLSADSDMADTLSELQDIVFMSNSDCHSPWPHRIGREFNRLLLKEVSFKEIVKAFDRNGGRKFTLNAGLNPKEGKYHVTACSRCFTKFRIDDAVSLKYRCPECRGLIKKGVSDRIRELADRSQPVRPKHRPPYLHILPLAEVISLAKGVKSLFSKKVQDDWKLIVGKFGTEINALVDVPVDEIKKADQQIGIVIERFRTGRISYVAGGGGQYGRPTLKEEKEIYFGAGQKKLTEW
ncbi:MAG: TIGR00375 family protein [Candidatus Altiarchaeota archaeon]